VVDGTLRLPAVAGRFYPAAPDELTRELEDYMSSRSVPREARAVIVPHAGYMYSGAIAGATFARVNVPARVIVLCPNHTGLGERRAVYASGTWRLPTGDVEVDAELAAAIREDAKLADDVLAHRYEHAIEVELPFLKARRPDVRVVPICLARLSVEECERIAMSIVRVLERCAATRETLLVASTDFSHYVTAAQAKKLDQLAIERIEALDAGGLYDTVMTREISMCGFIPTTVSLFAAKALGATRATLVRYGNSGERSGDYERVVGYAGFVLS
jgi:AmmeMemoRadiSam system protein B